jgi:hypothetical protein
MPYEIDDADGRCLYRGDDLALACEIHDGVPTARLLVLPPVAAHHDTRPVAAVARPALAAHRCVA